MSSKIIDVSVHNGDIDWEKVAADEVSDAIIRLSLGYENKDQRAEKHAKGAAQWQIDVSYYHVAYPGKVGGSVAADAKQEANYFTSLFQAGLMPSPKWLAVDFEKKSDGSDTSLNDAEFLSWLQTFLAEVYAVTHITCLIYSNASYLDQHLPSNHPLGSIPLWIANYNNVPTPPMPNLWDDYFL